MTDKEKAIVMAYTGVVMLKGDKIQIFYKYVEKIMGRPILTHEMAQLATEIKEKSKKDFMTLCKESTNEWTLYNEKNTKREEAIKMLTTIKKQAHKSIAGDNTIVIWDVNIDSFNFVIDRAIKLIKQEPKAGHWVVSEAFGFGNICECSECKESVWIYKDTETWNYCPKCGLKMEEK